MVPDGFVLLILFVVAVGVLPAVVSWWRAPPPQPPQDDALARFAALKNAEQGRKQP